MRKLLFDLFPVILFFLVFKFAGIYAATAAAIAATIVQVVWVKYHHGKVDGMLWVSFGIIVVMGGATLWLHDETFIKWKPTLLYWVFGTVLLFSRLLLGKNLMRTLLDEKMSLPDPVWNQLNLAWAGFFTLLGGVNLYVAYHYTTEQWVNFKLFGVTGMILCFVLLQAMVLSKYVEQEDK
jgi:intracellular septation protein